MGVLLVVEIYERVVKSQPYGRSGDVPFLSKRAYKRVIKGLGLRGLPVENELLTITSA